jgi:hypothetical protein
MLKITDGEERNPVIDPAQKKLVTAGPLPVA